MFHTRPRLQSTCIPHFPIICSSGQTPEKRTQHKAFLSQILERLSQGQPSPHNSSVLKKVAEHLCWGPGTAWGLSPYSAWTGLRSAWVLNLLSVLDHPERALGLSPPCACSLSGGCAPAHGLKYHLCTQHSQTDIPAKTFLPHISKH